MSKESIGDRIRKIREERGVSASNFARSCEVSPTAVWNWENNGTNPREETLKKIARVLGVTKEYLQGSEELVDSSGNTPQELMELLREAISESTGFELGQIKVSVSITPAAH